MKKLLLAALLASGLTSCAQLANEAALYAAREETLENVMGDTWQLKAVWPWENRTIKLREGLMEKAQQHCRKSDKGALLLDAVTQLRPNNQPGSEGLIVFRCVGTLPPPVTLFSEEE